LVGLCNDYATGLRLAKKNPAHPEQAVFDEERTGLRDPCGFLVSPGQFSFGQAARKITVRAGWRRVWPLGSSRSWKNKSCGRGAGLHQDLKQMTAGFEAKPEIRRSKSQANSKSEARRRAALAKQAWIEEHQNSDFGFRSSFGFRASGFGLARPAESI
jgi:hypothetical protein